jgi:hypothetical protein
LKKGTQDIFGKIDALLGKRETDVFVDKGLSCEDFPTLTDVVTEVSGGNFALELRGDSVSSLNASDDNNEYQAELYEYLSAMEKRIVDLVESRHEEILRILMDRGSKA